MLNVVPTWVVMLVVAILILALNELGIQLGRIKQLEQASDASSIVVQGAAFTLVGLLLAFSFSLSLGRYDARRTVLVREANAIGTTWLRTDLLRAEVASPMRAALRRYVTERIDFLQAETDTRERTIVTAESGRLQQEMWRLAMTAAREDPRSTTIPLFVSTLNDTIDLSTEEDAVQEAHIPDIVIIGLVLIILIASGMMGFGLGRQGQRAILSPVLLALTLAISIGLVLDLDRPQRGLIRVNLAPLQTLQTSFGLVK